MNARTSISQSQRWMHETIVERDLSTHFNGDMLNCRVEGSLAIECLTFILRSNEDYRKVSFYSAHGKFVLRWFLWFLTSNFGGSQGIDFKDFRLQRKTLLLFYWFFFTVIKVFGLQRKALLLSSGFCFPIIIISLTPYFKNAWTDFHEIFWVSGYWFKL